MKAEKKDIERRSKTDSARSLITRAMQEGSMELDTERLVLRDLRDSDYAAIREIMASEIAQKYEASTVPEEAAIRAEHDEILRMATENPRTNYKWGVTIRPLDVVKGRLSLVQSNALIHEWEIGWAIHPDHWSKGYASEAAREVLRFAFEQLKAHRVVAFCHHQNAASYRVMEKIGLRREGLLRGTRWWNNQWTDEYVYGMLEKDWQKTWDLL